MLEVVTEHKSILGEGPVWDFKKKTICWVDIVQGEIHEWNPSLKLLTTLRTFGRRPHI